MKAGAVFWAEHVAAIKREGAALAAAFCFPLYAHLWRVKVGIPSGMPIVCRVGLSTSSCTRHPV
jgi:hypothetical protein